MRSRGRSAFWRPSSIERSSARECRPETLRAPNVPPPVAAATSTAHNLQPAGRMIDDPGKRRRDGITPLDTFVAFASRRRLRGAARLRRFLRGHHEVALTRVRTSDRLLFDLDVESFLDEAILDHGYYEREVLN